MAIVDQKRSALQQRSALPVPYAMDPAFPDRVPKERYFDPDFYQRHYATDRQMQQFITLMADPIHPNAIGHHVLADALAPLVCPATR